jgi:hypothetical protein
MPPLGAAEAHSLRICARSEPVQGAPTEWKVSGCGSEFPTGTAWLHAVLTGMPMGSSWSVEVKGPSGEVVHRHTLKVKHQPTVAALPSLAWPEGQYVVRATGPDGAVLAEASFRLVEEPLSPTVIVPGRSIGPIRLGMTIQDATRVLGTPKATQAGADGTTAYMWYENVSLGRGVARSGKGLEAVARKDGVIVRVIDHYDPKYATPQGVTVGWSERRVREVLGDPARVENLGHAKGLVYSSGLLVVVVTDPSLEGYGTVGEIVVMPPE